MLCTIVGAGPGVGLGVARAFHREGFRIALIARRPKKIAALMPEALTVAGDAGDAASLRQAIDVVHREAGPSQVLVYNASMMRQAIPSALQPEQLVEDFQVNVVGALVAAQAVLDGMKADRKGTILLTGGGLALNPYAGVASLAIGKAGIRSLAYSLFEELRPMGIHAATVTICGYVQEGTHFSPDRIAAEYLKLHHQSEPGWTPETIYR